VNYSKIDGLPSSTVHEAFQDSKGYMWFCTDMGISRFDGESFENFNLRDGLCSNIIIHGTESPEGILWFLSASNQLMYFDTVHTGFVCHPLNKEISEKILPLTIHKLFAER